MPERVHKGRPFGEKVPCEGAASISDEEFRRRMWSTVPDSVTRIKGKRSGR